MTWVHHEVTQSDVGHVGDVVCCYYWSKKFTIITVISNYLDWFIWRRAAGCGLSAGTGAGGDVWNKGCQWAAVRHLDSPPLTMEEFCPLEEVELAEGEVVICWGDTSIELRPPEEVAEVSEDSGLRRFSSGLVWLGRSLGGFLGAISAFRLHRDILNSWLNLTEFISTSRGEQYSSWDVISGIFWLTVFVS